MTPTVGKMGPRLFCFWLPAARPGPCSLRIVLTSQAPSDSPPASLHRILAPRDPPGSGDGGKRKPSSPRLCSLSAAMRPRRPLHRSTWDVLALQLLLLLLPGAVQGSFEVSVWPEAPMVEHGGSVWINCSSTCRDVSCRGGLETSLSKARSESGSGWVAFYLIDIREWASTPQCYFTNGTETQSVTANISVYRAPEQVVLEPLPELELGRAYNLTCRVLSVAPVRHLTVTLRRGGQTLHMETFQNHTKSEADNITVTHQITPRRRDHGQEVTCHAALDLRPHGPLFQRSSTVQELSVYAPPHNVTVSVAQPTFPPGANITVRCSAQGNPPPELRWELPSNASVELSDRGRTVTVSSAQRTHSGTYRCLAQNRYGASSGQVDVLVKDPPKRWGYIAAVVVVGVIVSAAGAWLFVRKRFGTS